jgi:hypothetical protein
MAILSIPSTLRAGDSWSMTAAPAAYPGPDWALSVLLVNAAAATPLDAVWSEEDEIHTVTVTPAESVLFTAGRYSWYLVATNDTDGLRATLEEGVVDVLPDPVTATPVNAPSHAYRMLAAIEALLESRATAGDVDIVRAAFRDRQMEYDMAGLLKLRSQYAALVAQEQDAARIAAGLGSGRFVQTRFAGCS